LHRIITKMMIKEHIERPLVATKNEIDENRYALTQRLNAWRAHQQVFMPTIFDSHVLALPPCDPEEDTLFLPSDFTAPQREDLSLSKMADEEAELREGQACETILQLRNVVKHLASLRGLKAKNASGQKNNSRASTRIGRARFTCQYILEIYGRARMALEALGRLDDVDVSQRFPVLTQESLQRKSTTEKRALGDTYECDGGLWTSGGTFDFPASLGSQSIGIRLDDGAIQHEGAIHLSFLFYQPYLRL
jgi:hypothetical protein